MSAVSSGTTGGDADSLIDLSIHYDEYGNVVSESGYLLDENGSLVVCNDEGLTAAYSVTDNHGVTWIVGEDAAIVDTMIRSTIDPEAGTTCIDQYGNAVTAEGYLIDQSDSDGGMLIVSAGELSIQEQVVTEVAAGDGTTYTFADGENATFTDTGTTAGNVYVQVSEVSETYYDAYGSQLTSSDTAAVLADSDGTSLSVTASHVTSGYVYDDGTHEYAVASAGGGSYYVVAWGEVTQFYVGGTQLQAGDAVYADSDGTFHLLQDSAVTGSFAAAGAVIALVATQTAITDTEAAAGHADATYFLALSSDTAYTLTYHGSSAFTWPSAVTDSDADAGWYTVVTVSGASHWVALDVTTATVNGYIYYYDGATLYSYAASEAAEISYTGSTLPLDVVVATAGVYAATTASAWLIAASGALSDDADGSTAAASTVSLAADTVYAGWQLAYDDAGNWVSLPDSGGDTWYLAASADTTGTTLVLKDVSELTGDAHYYSLHGHAYYTTASATDADGVTYYYDFDRCQCSLQ